VRPALLALLVAAVCGLAAASATGQGPQPEPPRDDPDPAIVDGSAQRALDAARRRWRRAGIHNYRFEIERSCFCPLRRPVVIFVRDDRPVRPPADFRSLATVRRLHRRVQGAIDDHVSDLSVRYDRHGMPRRIAIDGRAYIADDEVTYTVDRFWRGTKGRGGPDTPTPSTPEPR